MGYTVPDWKKSIDQNIYPVTVGKKTFNLPKASYMTGEQAERMQNAEANGESMYDVLDSIAHGLGTALRAVPVKYVMEMVEDWQKDSGITVGESAASSSS